MSVDPGRYLDIEFMAVGTIQIGGLVIVIGEISEDHRLLPLLYAAALDERSLRHTGERAFGATMAEATAALFNKIH